MNAYQEHILDKYQHPKFHQQPKLFDLSSQAENLSCGDEVKVYIELAGDKVKQINYTGAGCVIMLASAEILAEELVNKSRSEIAKMDYENIINFLKIPLTSSRIRCAMLPLEAIQKALR